LQVKLFVRLGNRVTLTDADRALKPSIGDAFAIMDEACAAFSRSRLCRSPPPTNHFSLSPLENTDVQNRFFRDGIVL
jgi:DNA-binding transcriptional LysR family regulator